MFFHLPIHTANNNPVYFLKIYLLQIQCIACVKHFKRRRIILKKPPYIFRTLQFFGKNERYLIMKALSSFIICLVLVTGSAFMPPAFSFEETQKHYARVDDAYNRKEQYVLMRCRTNEIPEETFGNVLIRAFKMEQIVEVWVQKPNGRYVKFNEFSVYALSGTLGPKRQQGDCQVPEGYYYIDDFNPVSNYHLSLGISYPNESDMKLSNAPKKGGDIYMHGGKASAGCLAMSNYYIEDIYICAVKAHSNGQKKIPVQIFPFKPTQANLDYYTRMPQFSKYAKFWRNIAQGYQLFEKYNRVADTYVSSDGLYQFVSPASVEATAK